MRYLVTARLRDGKSAALRRAIDDETLGRGSVAGDEYLRNMGDAREYDDGRVQWVEVCYCPTPLAEEREYWSLVVRRLRLLGPPGEGPGRPRSKPLPRRKRYGTVVVLGDFVLAQPRAGATCCVLATFWCYVHAFLGFHEELVAPGTSTWHVAP